MIDLLLSGGSFLASAAGGSFVKILSGLLFGYLKNKREGERERHEDNLASRGQSVAEYRQIVLAEGKVTEATRFVLWTRRMLALLFVGTFCYITILWAKNPTTPITTFSPAESGVFQILWGLISYPTNKDITVVVSAGAIVWGLMNVVTFVAVLYFTPGGSTTK